MITFIIDFLGMFLFFYIIMGLLMVGNLIIYKEDYSNKLFVRMYTDKRMIILTLVNSFILMLVSINYATLVGIICGMCFFTLEHKMYNEYRYRLD